MNWLDAIEARLKAATPGPWKINEKYRGIIDGPNNELALASIIMRPDEDGQFIAYSPTDTALLISALKEAMEGLRIISKLHEDSKRHYADVARTALERIATLGSAAEKMGDGK